MLKIIDCNHAEQLLSKGNCKIFDVRDEKAYADGHLPNAIYLNHELLSTICSTEDRNQTILIYCYKGVRSQMISKILIESGFTHVYSLDGGYQAWSEFSQNR